MAKMKSAIPHAQSADFSSALLRVSSLAWRSPPRTLRSEEGAGADFGTYVGLPPHIELLADGRRVRLLKPLCYVQSEGSNWPVPAGVELDGASIPRFAWSLIGGPFEGLYRDASIIHDHYCAVRSRRGAPRTACSRRDALQQRSRSRQRSCTRLYRFGPRWDEGRDHELGRPALPRLQRFPRSSFAAMPRPFCA